jgi:uridine kinase
MFVDTPGEICLRRGIERDICTGKTKDELAHMWHGWFAAEDKYMRRDNPKEYADLLVDGTKPFDGQLWSAAE